MKIELSKIPEKGLIVNQDVQLNQEYFKNSSIIEIKKLHIEGKIAYDYESSLVLELDITGEFLLEDSLTLNPIIYPFSTQIEEKIENIEENYEKFYEKSKNVLDISEILWENIVLEIPISVSNTKSEDLSLKGNGWELKNETEEKIDPRFEKLNELFKEGKD